MMSILTKSKILKKRGAIALVGLTSPGFSWEMNDTEMCIWGGIQLDRYYKKQTHHRKSTILDVKLYSGSSDFSSDNIDHISIKYDIPIQFSTQKARAGHFLNNVPSSSK